MGLSVIIPTYKNVLFLDELFSSLQNSIQNEEYEVLVGIDNCIETLQYIYQKQFIKNINFFFFTKNVGPYTIKNTLVKISKFEKIFFFDSDDVFLPHTLNVVNDELDRFELVKPKYQDFEVINNQKVFSKKNNTFGEGVFGIRKKIFLNVNGFEGWRVAADSDLMGRLYKTNIKLLHTNQILFHRRIHANSLTIHPETGSSSKLRSELFLISKNKNHKDIKNKNYVVAPYKAVDLHNKEFLPSIEQTNEDVEYKINEEKKLKHEAISNILNTQIKTPKTNKTINYQQINQQNNVVTHPNLSKALKKAKLENIKKSFRR